MSSSPTGNARAHLAWPVLIGLLGIETLAGLIALIPLGTGFFDAGGDDFGQRVSVLLAALIAILWVAVTFLGALRSRASWSRGSAMTLHILMFAAGTGSLQYGLAPTAIAWILVLAAFVGFFSALLARPEYAPMPEEDLAE